MKQALGRIQSITLESIFRAVAIAFVIVPVATLQYADTLTMASLQLHFPIPGFEFFALPLSLFVSGWMLFVSAALAIFGWRLRFSLLVLGLSSLAFWIGTTEMRFAFSYYVPLALVAFGVQSLTGSNRRLSIVFIGAVYLTAAIHKLIVFPTMIDFLPASIQQMFIGGFTASQPDLSNLIARMFGWLVVPVEFSMGFFFLFERTRRYAFLLACSFHSLIGVINHGGANLWEVGTSVLAVHAWVATSGSTLRLKDVARIPGRFLILGVWAIGLFACIFGPEAGFFHQVAQTTTLLLPSMAVAGFCYFGGFENNELNEPSRAILGGFVSFMMVWALAPFILGHTNDHIGFAMFSGGSHKTPFHCFQIKGPLAEKCPYPRRRLPIITRREVGPKQIEYCSRQESSIEKFREWSRERCRDAEFDSKFYIVDPDGPAGFEFLYQ